MFNLKTVHFNQKEFHPYYQNYIDKRSSNDIIKGLKNDKKNFIDFIKQIPSEKWRFAYYKGKWTVAEVVSHIIDTERIFSYRALRFARGDKTALAGFDQDFYAVNSNANEISIENMLIDFSAVRTSSITLFSSFTEKKLLSIGVASEYTMSARAVGYILSGHQNHHEGVLKERYLN